MSEFQYLLGIKDGIQINFAANTWFKTRDNYWECTQCNAILSTKGKIYKDPNKPFP